MGGYSKGNMGQSVDSELGSSAPSSLQLSHLRTWANWTVKYITYAGGSGIVSWTFYTYGTLSRDPLEWLRSTQSKCVAAVKGHKSARWRFVIRAYPCNSEVLVVVWYCKRSIHTVHWVEILRNGCEIRSVKVFSLSCKRTQISQMTVRHSDLPV